MQTTPESRGPSESRGGPETRGPSEFAEAARIADLRLEQWYEARRLKLPLEVQAEFTSMAFEAIARDRTRDPEAVMDDLIDELDQRLGRIQSSQRSDGRASRRARPSLLQRLRRPFARTQDDDGRSRRH
ncbi:hypothetical protein ACFFGH_02605 [Lysobacter korlensis]|uniref:Uncharacterized protein n=1 Tax=Lysobacter korlensis TaxID=553636 RepID=A0ABV6RID5_9GAMM